MQVGQGAPLGRRPQVVQHQTHHGGVDARVRQVELPGQPGLPAHALGAGLDRRERQRFRVAVDRDHLDVRPGGGQGDGECPGTGADVEHATAAGDAASSPSRKIGRQRASRIVSAIEASYRAVGPKRPAART